jgi:hypothetical protein
MERASLKNITLKTIFSGLEELKLISHRMCTVNLAENLIFSVFLSAELMESHATTRTRLSCYIWQICVIKRSIMWYYLMTLWFTR